MDLPCFFSYSQLSCSKSNAFCVGMYTGPLPWILSVLSYFGREFPQILKIGIGLPQFLKGKNILNFSFLIFGLECKGLLCTFQWGRGRYIFLFPCTIFRLVHRQTDKTQTNRAFPVYAAKESKNMFGNWETKEDLDMNK